MGGGYTGSRPVADIGTFVARHMVYCCLPVACTVLPACQRDW